jgi:hypothetical protein
MSVENANQINQVNNQNQTEMSGKNDVANELRKVATEQKDIQKMLDAKQFDMIKSDEKQLEAVRQEKQLDIKQQKDPGISILRNLADDLAKMGIMKPLHETIGKRAAKGALQEVEGVWETRGVSDEQHVGKDQLTKEAIKRASGREQEQKREEKESQKEKETQQKLLSPGVKEALQQYSAAYAQVALSGNSTAKDKLEDAKDKLREKGFSNEDLSGVERGVKRQIGKQLVTDVQDSFIQHMFSEKNTFDFVVSSRKFSSTVRQSMEMEEKGGLPADAAKLNDTINSVKDQSVEQVKEFVRAAVDSTLMEMHVNGTNDPKELRKYVELGYRVGFNFEAFIREWQQQKVDLGLVAMAITAPKETEAKGNIAIGDVNANGVSDKHGYEFTKDEEKELLMNQLRAEYMKKAISGDPFAVFTFNPKIMKLKNGLIQLKLNMSDADFSRIEKEGRILARVRTLEMLKGAFIERSTFYELAGSAYGLLNNKIKGLISNLERLDMKLSKEELDILRDDANRAMYDNTLMELKSAVSILETQENPSLEQKVPLMIKLVQRLRDESGFKHGLGEDLDEAIYRHNNNMKSIKEGA